MSHVGVEGVAERLELGAQLAEVVDLAVVGELHETVVGAHRLVTTGGVDDGEAAVAEAGERVLEEALAVGTPVGDPAGHGGQEGGVGRAPEPGNATHGRRSLQGTSSLGTCRLPEAGVDSPDGRRPAPVRRHRAHPRCAAPRAPRVVRGDRRARLHRRVVVRGRRPRRLHAVGAGDGLGTDAARRHRDRARLHPRPRVARAVGGVARRRRARSLRARHRRVVARDRRALERHPVRSSRSQRTRDTVRFLRAPSPARR